MNQKLHGSNIISVKAHNLQAVLLSLLYEDNLSRTELAERINLSSTTITNLITELLEEGLVSESSCNDQELENNRPVGRPRTALCLEPNARFVVGVHVGVGTFRIALTNLRDEIVASTKVTFGLQENPLQVLDQIVVSIEDLINDSQTDRNSILGVGVGLSGLVDFETGVNVLAPNLNWRQVPVNEVLTKQLKLPVVADNNVRCMALGEAYFGIGRELSSLAFVYGRIGVGAGFIYQGKVFRGSSMGAGEIGHTTSLLHGGEPCRCGKTGCLETLVSETAFINQAQEISRLQPDGVLAGIIKASPNEYMMNIIIEAARQGDENVQEMLADRACYLGVALANMVNLYNPEMIILGGLFTQAQEYFIDPLKETVQRFSFGDLGKQVRIEGTGFGWKAGVIGAAALALTHLFYLRE